MRIYKFLFTCCILCFVSLCFLHYFSSRPLWLDENFIFSNIKGLKSVEILGPLKNSQAFPRIYLIIVNNLAQKFNYNVLSLRFIPLISMLLAFFIWAKIYKKWLPDKWQVLLASFSFASSYSMSYYASELKHYSMDVLVVGIFCLYLTYQKQLINGVPPVLKRGVPCGRNPHPASILGLKEPPRLFILTTLLLPLTILFSYSSFFVFWLVIYNFLFMIKKKYKALALMVSYTFVCFLFIIIVFYFDLKYSLSDQSLFSYWNDYFLCTSSFYCFIKSFGEGLRKLSVWWFGNSKFFIRFASFLIPFFVLSLFGYGIKSLRKNKFMIWDIDAMCLIIFLELFVLGIIKRYPFTGERVTLFFAPFVFYLIIKGINFLKMNKLLYFSFNIFYIVFLIVCSLNSFLTYLKLYN